jgi:hypothetical protein
VEVGQKRVGLLVGRESTLPPALIHEINRRQAGVVASYVKVGEVRAADRCRYDLIIDRISHGVPFYRAYLKNAVLGGTRVLNNPFLWAADDKFFNYSLGAALGLATPRTVLLPQKSYKEGIVSESLRNLEYPLDWDRIIEYVGFPAYLKPIDGGGWRKVWQVNSREELLERYDASGTDCMVLQQLIEWERYVRVYCIARRDVLVIPYDPICRRYLSVRAYLDSGLESAIINQALKINRGLGYDVNTVEFAVSSGVPYAIDYMNPAPEIDWYSLGPCYFSWLVSRLGDFAVEIALNPQPTLDIPPSLGGFSREKRASRTADGVEDGKVCDYCGSTECRAGVGKSDAEIGINRTE